MSHKFFLPDQFYKPVNVHGPNSFNIITTLDDSDTVRFTIDTNLTLNQKLLYEIENASADDFSIANTGNIILDSNGNATLVANLNIFNNITDGNKSIRLKLSSTGGEPIVDSAYVNINVNEGPNITSNSNIYSTVSLTDRIIHKWIGANTDTSSRTIYFTVNDIGNANNIIQILQVAPGGGAINQTGWSTNIATRQRASGGAGAGEHANYTIEAWHFDSAYYDPGSYTNTYQFDLTPSGKGQTASNPDYTITPTSGTDLSIIKVGTTAGFYVRPFNSSPGATQDYVNYVRPGFTTYYNPKGGGHGGTYKDGVTATSGKGGGAAGNGARGTATPLGYLGGLGSLGGFDGTYYDIVGGGGGGSASGNGENANSTIPVEGDGAAPTTITFISNYSTTTQSVSGGSDGVSYRQLSPNHNSDKPGGGGHIRGGPAALFINVPKSSRNLSLA